MEEFHPSTEEEVEDVIAWALAHESPLEILGAGSKRAVGHTVKADTALHMNRLSGILSYEPEELVISAWAGTPLAEIEAILAAEGQHLAFEPPDYSKLLGSEAGGTLGGAIAAGFAGPRRLTAGSARDHVLGVTGVTGRGETFKIGGRVVKNVTGYDLSKLLAGSFGTLAVMTRITLKVLPRAEVIRTLCISDRNRNDALELLRQGAASPFSVTGAALSSDGDAHLRLEGREDEIDKRMDKLRRHLGVGQGGFGGETSEVFWQSVRDLSSWAEKPNVWRINLPRAAAAGLADALAMETGGEMIFDWAGSRLWFAPERTERPETIRGLCDGAGGKAMVFKASAQTRQKYPVFHPEQKALARLSARVRDAFDPVHILNPGRLSPGPRGED
jgi:glycolate oxidase FAD binding subunit